MADLAAFEGYDARLSNLINEHLPSLKNPVTQYLAADPNDSEIEGRLKNAIEGLALGPVAEGLFLSIKAIRQARQARIATSEIAQDVSAAATDTSKPNQISLEVPHWQSAARDRQERDAQFKAFIAGQKSLSLEELYPRAEGFQRKLIELGQGAGAATGAEFINPSIKKFEEAGVKIADRQIEASDVVDLARIGFSVQTPAQGDAIVAKLAQQFQILDYGWKIGEGEYRDRKVLVRDADGTVGEVQIIPHSIYKAKEIGGGHVLYKQEKRLLPGLARLPLQEQQKRLYSEAASKLGPEWGNVFEVVKRK